MTITLIYTTVKEDHDAESLIRSLLEEGLIACGLRLDAQSAFEWHGEPMAEDEIAILLKTSDSAVQAASAAIEKRHPYEVPMILSWRVDANQAYERWVSEQTA